ncbi:MAG: hypothetical protein Q9P01_20730 [Anaerolineae bacterium]|nr:hypothetical protein [Anaerolineae bacterium]MDQ7037174.1 hypothetical protein [Anaerolineae bacterium]
MTKLEISSQAAKKLKEASEMAQKTIDEFILSFVDSYVATIDSDVQTPLENDVAWTEEEVQELIKPVPLTGKEMVEGGFVGGWEDKGISDPVAFLEQQRVNRKWNKFSW